MRRRSWLLALALAALVSAWAAPPLYAAANLITSCTKTVQITSPGAYLIGNDLRASSAGFGICIMILAPDVVLDLNGHTIRGPGGFSEGITIALAATNARVVNGSITGFGTGLVDGGSRALLSGLDVSGSKGAGIEVVSIPNHVLSDTVVARNHVHDNDVGILLLDVLRVQVLANTVTDNGGDGIALVLTSAQNQVAGNTVQGNRRHGIFVGAGTSLPLHERGNRIEGNTVSGSQEAIDLAPGAVQTTVVGNAASGDSSVDLADDNPGCDANRWVGNRGSVSQPCIH